MAGYSERIAVVIGDILADDLRFEQEADVKYPCLSLVALFSGRTHTLTSTGS